MPHPPSAPAIAISPRRPSPGAFLLLVSLMITFLAGSSAPTPLYPLLQQAWGFDARTTTVIFGIYALGVLTSLLLVGALSDAIGRRPVLLVTTLLQAGVMGLYLRAHGVGELLVGRVVQGLVTGAAAGAVGAALLDRDRVAGTLANSISPLLGTATGAIAGALAVQWLPDPTHRLFWLLLVVYLVQAVLVGFLPEIAQPRLPLARVLRPSFHLPPATLPALGVAVPIIVAAWSLAGLNGSLGPALVQQLAHRHAPLLAGSPLAALALGGAVAVLVLRQHPGDRLMRWGAAGLIVGMGVVLIALAVHQVAGFLAGMLVAGAGFGIGFQGGMRTVLAAAPPAHRAGVLSVLYVVAYLAMGLPAMAAGIAARQSGVAHAATGFAAAVLLLATLTAWRGRARRLAPAPPSPTRPGVGSTSLGRLHAVPCAAAR